MRKEVYDKKSGAILFKKDQESKDVDKLIKKVAELEKKIANLEKQIKSK